MLSSNCWLFYDCREHLQFVESPELATNTNSCWHFLGKGSVRSCLPISSSVIFWCLRILRIVLMWCFSPALMVYNNLNLLGSFQTTLTKRSMVIARGITPNTGFRGAVRRLDQVVALRSIRTSFNVLGESLFQKRIPAELVIRMFIGFNLETKVNTMWAQICALVQKTSNSVSLPSYKFGNFLALKKFLVCVQWMNVKILLCRK